jgi:carbonic anhydrase
MKQVNGTVVVAWLVLSVSVAFSHPVGAKVAEQTSSAAVAQTKESQAAITPAIALQMLKDGNARFTGGKMIRRDLRKQVQATASGQYPFASVVSCIDSRSSPELVFDQGIGDIFAARIAGNFVNDDILGSLEFASKLAGSRLILVLGHTECGAIKGACDNAQLGNLTTTLAKLKPAVDAVSDDGSARNSKNAAFVQRVAEKNVKLAIEQIRTKSAVLREMEEKREIAIVGAMLDIGTGKVTFYDVK